MKNRRSLTVNERQQYIKSVKCLLAKAPISKRSYPAVTNRYEDFVALHANATNDGLGLYRNIGLNIFGSEHGVHWNHELLPWHRYMIWAYENTLRDECGYRGTQPCEYLVLF
jgi:tyrosinase